MDNDDAKRKRVEDLKERLEANAQLRKEIAENVASAKDSLNMIDTFYEQFPAAEVDDETKLNLKRARKTFRTIIKDQTDNAMIFEALKKTYEAKIREAEGTQATKVGDALLDVDSVTLRTDNDDEQGSDGVAPVE